MQNKKKMPTHSPIPISDFTRHKSCGVEPRENASPMWRKWPLPSSLFFPFLSLVPFVCHALRETVRPLMEEPTERWASETCGQRCQATSGLEKEQLLGVPVLRPPTVPTFLLSLCVRSLLLWGSKFRAKRQTAEERRRNCHALFSSPLAPSCIFKCLCCLAYVGTYVWVCVDVYIMWVFLPYKLAMPAENGDGGGRDCCERMGRKHGREKWARAESEGEIGPA